MARLGSAGNDVISRCLRPRARQDRDQLVNSGEIIRGGPPVMGPDPNDYKLVYKIGVGCFGSISLALHKPTSTRVAIRETSLDSANKGSVEDIELLSREIRVCRLLRHPDIIRYTATFIREATVWSVTTLMTHRSARDILSSVYPSGLPELVIRSILRPILSAVDYLHSRAGIIHRSIAAHHILLGLGQTNEKPLVKLSGFHYSVSAVDDGRCLRKLHEFPPHSTRILFWLAPEVLRQNAQGYNAKSDVYSLGIAACELANGEVPFEKMATTQVLYYKLKEGCKPFPYDNEHPPAEKRNAQDWGDEADEDCVQRHSVFRHRHFSPSFHDLVSLALSGDQSERPSASDLLAHPFIKPTKRSACYSPDPLFCLLKSLPSVLDDGAEAGDHVSPLPPRPHPLARAPIVRSESDLSAAWDFD